MLNEQMLVWFPVAALAAYLPAAVLGLVGRERFCRLLGSIGLVALLLGVGSICWVAWRPPMYGPFESMMYLASVIGVVIWFSGRGRAPLPGGWAESLISGILLILLTFPAELDVDFYMYDHALPILFFQLRLVAVGILMSASLFYLTSLTKLGQNTQRAQLVHNGRNFLLLGMACFLGGEFSGSLWCLLWLGEYWRWTNNFLMATLMFLLMMPAFHLPPRLAAKPVLKALLGGLPGLILFALTIVHQVLHA